MSRPVKRSFAIKGHRTSISLEAAFWDALKEAAVQDSKPLAQVISEIDDSRGTSGLSSAVRIWLLERYRSRAKSAQPSTATPAPAPAD